MKFKNDFIARQPESLQELHDFIIYQLRTSDKVTINLSDGDDMHELLESIADGMRGTRCLNKIEGEQA